MPKQTDDKVNHPKYYIANGIEVIDVVEAFGLPPHLCKVVEYVLRCDRKDAGVNALQDLKKAQFYLNREIENRVRSGESNGR